MQRGSVVDGVRQHLKAASDSEEFARRVLARGDVRDLGWAITAVFYSAVHVVRAYLGACAVTVASHEECERYFRLKPELSNGFPKYKTLKQLSEAHRYYNQLPDAAEVMKALDILRQMGSLITPKTRHKCPDAFPPVADEN